jgi:hypothetical protein
LGRGFSPSRGCWIGSVERLIGVPRTVGTGLARRTGHLRRVESRDFGVDRYEAIQWVNSLGAMDSLRNVTLQGLKAKTPSLQQTISFDGITP